MIGGCSHLSVGARELRGLYPPCWSQRIKGFVSSLRLKLENRGLYPLSSFSWKIGKLVFPMNVFFLIIRKEFSGFI
jgi:hypothetical protein